MKKTTCVLLIALALLLSACASQPPRKIVNNDSEPAVSGEAETVSEPSRESVFIYSKRQSLSSRLVLSLAGEPVLLPSGYIRLVGVVSGGKPTACLEIGGRGLALEEGETIDAYRIVRINGHTVVLERRNNKLK
jgi:hypothetical protein